jgi:hypothetical protein
MKISTQVTLNQKELDEAVVAYVADKMGLQENAEVTVEFVDDDRNKGELQAIVNISAGGEAPTKPAAKAAPAPKRERAKAERVKAEAEQPKAAITSTPEGENVKAAISTGEERKAPDDEPPFAVEAPKTAPKIFPDASTSAPASLPQPDVSATAKSLFANLIKPTQ